MHWEIRRHPSASTRAFSQRINELASFYSGVCCWKTGLHLASSLTHLGLGKDPTLLPFDLPNI